jgi:type I restriction enzyme S subunit
MSWPIAKIGKVCKLVNGDRGSNYPSKENILMEGIPFINAGNLTHENSIACSGANYISEERYNLLSNGKVRHGDILFCLRGSLGKFGIVDSSILKGAIASSLVIIRSDEMLDGNYLKNYLRSSVCAREISRFENGAAQPNLSAKDLREFEIPLPPLPEQKRIAAILDKADAIRRKRQQAIQLADDFLRAVFLDMFGDPVTNPKGWSAVELGTLIVKGPTNGLYKHASEYGSGTPILRIDGFYDGRLVNHEKMKRVNLTSQEIEKFKLEERSLVINRVNSREYLGKSAFISGLMEGTVYESNMMNFSVDESVINSMFLTELLRTPYAKKQILSAAKDAVNQSSINQQDVKSLQVLLPPLTLQESFEKVVNRFEASAKKTTVWKGSVDNLLLSLSHKAFSGQL